MQFLSVKQIKGNSIDIAIAIDCKSLCSTIGGMLFDGSGYHTTFLASAVVLLFAVLLAFLTSRSQALQTA